MSEQSEAKSSPLEVDRDSESRFPSLDAMRSAHGMLMARYREEGFTPEMLPIMMQVIKRGRNTGAILDDDDDRWAAQSMLDYWSSTIYRANLLDVDGTLADFNLDLAPDIPDEKCPYLGLYPFHEANQGVFFGRERLVKSLVKHLTTNQFLSLTGPSGSGKSSLVLAGLIPALKEGAVPGSDNWHIYPTLVPGSRPLLNLARSLSPPDVSDINWAKEQAELMAADPRHLASLIDGQQQGETALVFIDQFEELFTLCLDKEQRQAFTANLLELLASDAGHVLVLTMRSDFETFVAQLAPFQDAFDRALMRVTPMNAAELRSAIEKPADRVGLKFDKDVVEGLLNDTLGEPAALPLLQFTLLKLWEERVHNLVTYQSYQKLGGGRLALARSADKFYDELIPEEQETAKRILLRMVRPGEGLEMTSNRIRRDALYLSGEDPGRIDRVLDKFIDAYLVKLTAGDTPADDQVEVAHEALVRNWPRLVDWLEAERERIRQRLRLTSAAVHWSELGRDDGALLRGALLEEALAYDDLDVLEGEFVQASKAARDRAQRLQEEARQRELRTARQLASERARSNRRLRLLVTVLALLLLVAIISAGLIYALLNQQADSRVLAQEATADALKASFQREQSARLAAEAGFLATSAAYESSLRLALEDEVNFAATATIAAEQGTRIPGAEATATANAGRTNAARADLLRDQFTNAASDEERFEALAGLFGMEPSWPGFDEADLWAREQFLELSMADQVGLLEAWLVSAAQQNSEVAIDNLITVVKGLYLSLDVEERDHLSIMAGMVAALEEAGTSESQALAREIAAWQTGRELTLAGDPEAALLFYDQAIEANDHHPIYYYDRALALAAVEQYEAALENLEQAVILIHNGYQPAGPPGVSPTTVGFAHPDQVLMRVGLTAAANDGLAEALRRQPGRFRLADYLPAPGEMPGSLPLGEADDEFRLAWPSEVRRVSQHFGANPNIYNQFGLPGHEGIDLAAPLGSAVFAGADGTVIAVPDQRTSRPSPYGWHVIIDHGDGYSVLYGILAPDPPVEVGQQVEAGQIIGYSGNTASSTGPHLHLTLKKEGEQLDGWPEGYIDPWPFLQESFQAEELLATSDLFLEGWVLRSALNLSDALAQPLVSGVHLRSGPDVSATSLTTVRQFEVLLVDGPTEGEYVPVLLPLCGRQQLENSLDGWLQAAKITRAGQLLGTTVAFHSLLEEPNGESAVLSEVPTGSTFFVIGPQVDGYVPVRFCQGLE